MNYYIILDDKSIIRGLERATFRDINRIIRNHYEGCQPIVVERSDYVTLKIGDKF